MAICKFRASVDAGRFLEFLKSDEAVQVFEKLGFGIAK
jgi:ABC-type molybdate transport system substrate-binding protein